MAKTELGTKRQCGECGAKFYDLAKSPIVCPKCGTEFVIAAATAASRREPAKPAPVVAEQVAEEPAESDVEIVSLDDVAADEAVDSDDDDIVVEDDTEIEDDDDDDDTFLEEDEDDDDVSGLLGGGVAGEDEEV